MLRFKDYRIAMIFSFLTLSPSLYRNCDIGCSFGKCILKNVIINNYLLFQSGEELMLIPQEEEKPAVTLKMSRSVTDEDKENSENYSHPVQS